MSSSLPCRTVDANVILRYVLRDDERLARKARAIWRAVEEGRLIAVLDPVTLAEVVFVMSSVYGLPRETIAETLTPLLQSNHVAIAAKERYLRALRLYADAGGHFGDASACACALEECEGRLYSFDRALSGVPGIERHEQLAD